MLKNNTLRLGLVATCAVMAVALGASAPAYADPAAGTYPALAGVGSDTTQDIVGGLASVIPSIGSYDAVSTTNTIQTRAGGPTFTRPNGSGAGQLALSMAITGGTYGTPAVAVSGQLDFARSSSGPDAALGTGGQLTFIPFARDAVTYAVSAASDFPRDIPQGSAAQDAIVPAVFSLRNIYRSKITTYTNADLDSVTINPLVPQAGSGTRNFWVRNAMGLTDATLGSTVSATNAGVSVQEHDGSIILGAGDIVPFSIAQYIAQGNHGALPTAVVERRGNIALGNISSAKPYVFAAGGGIELNAAFPITRLVYNVVSTPRLTGTSPADVALQTAFVGTGSSVCAASATIRQYGFASIGALCGNSTTYKQGLRLS
ncbi:MAG: hypothetical protein H7288_06830 [Kineosporiaceae bacterium]|nr:hypothetical protein [Aeromicrobium sp.]